MSDEQQQPIPLVTDYATNADTAWKFRPFHALTAELLEKLFIIRKWPIDLDNPNNQIPFKRPKTVRDFHYDILSEQETTTPLVIKEFQKQAIHHLIRMPRFILGDGVGLGKTLSALVAFAWLKERNPNAKMIVITTKSMTYQWQDECRRFTTLRPFVMLDTYNGLKSSEARYSQMINFLESDKKDILIVKYDSLKGTRKVIEKTVNQETGKTTVKREALSEEIETFSKIIKQHRENVVLVLDECHKFKTEWTQTRNLIFRLSFYPERVWALTATVIKNGMDEFYSIASAIGIRPLGWMKDFHAEHCIWREQHVGQGRMKQILVGYKNVPVFIREMRPFFLGRSQRQVKEPLPRLTTIYHPIDLDERQTKILTEDLPNGTIELPPILFKVAGEWREKERDPDNLMTQLSVQQLVTNHWCLLDRNDEKSYLTKKLSPKEECLLDMLDGDFRGEKVVVYTKYRSWIDRLQWLTNNGHFTKRKFLRITGAESEKQRAENKRKFQDPDSGYDLIVINAAGLEGINLQQAAHMILLDVPWSWGDLIQLVGRMVRMASPHTACTLHVMVAKGTIDEFAIETLRGKKGVFETILGESHSAGILDSGESFDLDSGMESGGSAEEFEALLKAHVKRVGMKIFLSGDQINQAQSDIQYKMTFERGNKVKKSSKATYEDIKWFSE